MASESRERMVASAAVLFGARGIESTSFQDVLAASGAPRGSIYYNFPHGKRELVEEALRWTTDQLFRYQRARPMHRPEEVVDRFVSFFRHSVVGSQCRAGCPVAAVVASQYSDEPALASLVRSTFRSWASVLSRQLRSVGMAPPRARSLAVTTLAWIEGALILCRAERSVAPLDEIRREVRQLARTQPGRPAPGRGPPLARRGSARRRRATPRIVRATDARS